MNWKKILGWTCAVAAPVVGVLASPVAGLALGAVCAASLGTRYLQARAKVAPFDPMLADEAKRLRDLANRQ